jgi:class III poly(R)-hydroxyalkanoic acid synthase PhaE subunit
METTSTTWTSLADQFVSTWTDAGTQMWKSWFDLMGAAQVQPTANSATNWQAGLTALVQRYWDSQHLWARLLRLSFESWQEFVPTLKAGDNTQDFLQNYSEKLRQQFHQFSSGTLKATEDINELWQLYLTEVNDVSQLWIKALGSSMSPWSQTLNGGSELWLELNNLYWNLLYEESFGSLMRSPLLGPSREVTGKLLRCFDAWVSLYRANLDHQVVLSDIQLRSLEALMWEVVERAEKGEAMQDWRQFQQLWGQVADREFERAFRSEDNLKVRGRFVNALNQYRFQQQELVELAMKLMNLPSRQEVDEVHQNIHELRKEVKALKKALAKYESTPAAPADVPPVPTAESPTDSSSQPTDAPSAAKTVGRSLPKSTPKSRKQPPPQT